MSTANLVRNGAFAVARVPAPPPTVTTKGAGQDNGGLSAADAWTTWNNAVPATIATDIVQGAGNPAGDGAVLHVVCSAPGGGIVQAFGARDHGPARVRTSAWVKVVRGRVILGTGNGGDIGADVSSTSVGRWELLSAFNGVAPANELIVYADAADTEFFVSHVTCEEVPVSTSQPNPLASLQPDGSPLVINYQVPEPIAFSGSNYIEIRLPAEAFKSVETQVTSPGAGSSPNELFSRNGTAVQAGDALQLPPGVRANGDADDAAPVLGEVDGPVTERLRRLTRGRVRDLAACGQRVVVRRAIGGVLDFQVTPAPVPAVAALAGLTAGVRAGITAHDIDKNPPGDGGPGDVLVVPTLVAFLDAPQDNSSFTGSAAGVVVRVGGRWQSVNTSGAPAVVVALDGQPAEAASVTQGANGFAGTFSLDLNVPTAGTHAITVTASKSALDSENQTVNLTSTVRRNISVQLESGDTNPAPAPPSVAIAAPHDGQLVISQQGAATLTVSGSAAAGRGATLARVLVESDGHGVDAALAGDGSWAVQVPLDGAGTHAITAIAFDAAGLRSPTASRSVVVSDQQPFRRLLNRLLIVETLNLSSFLGPFGAGRACKTFSLLPGESATISVKSYTKTSEEQKAASSIVDSNATESADSFEDSLAAEQSSNETLTEAQNYKIGANVTAKWGWGSASINGEYSGSANASRQETVKNVANATRKHSLTASSNRTVTINTEYQVQQESGVEESTQRTISNINVSRTLNFVFRQMNQQHVTLIHLTNARAAFYTEDLMLDAQGQPAYRKNPDGTDYLDPVTGAKVLDIRPTYRETPLPQLQALLDEGITEDYQSYAQNAILNALSGIPDHQDQLQAAYEWVIPRKQDGTPVPEARYMQFPRGLTTTFVDPDSDFTVTVPGIVLHYDHITLRTEAVMVETLLGPGDGLDDYAQQLQLVAIAERQAAVDQQQAATERERLAQKIVADKDDAAAAIYAKLYPPPPSPVVAG